MALTPKELAEEAAKLLADKKANNIETFYIEQLTILADYFVICSGTSTTHVRALADEVEFKLKQQGIPPLRKEGYNSSSWILLDYGSVVVHVFTEDTRSFYSLERLWADAPRIGGDGEKQPGRRIGAHKMK
jgi:ribosome-associated protein